MCIGVFSTALQKKQRAAFVIPNVHSFFVEKKYVIKNFILKRTSVVSIVSIVAKRGDR